MEIIKFVQECEEELKEEFRKVDEICLYNSNKVISAFRNNHLYESHLNHTTGYGHGDSGRDTIEAIYSEIFNCEDALVRSGFVSGTHALTVAFFAILRPGDILLSISGKPYDTLDSVIGFNDNIMSSVFYPKITTIKQPSYDMGSVAMRMLIKMLNKRELDESQFVLDYTLIERDSCK